MGFVQDTLTDPEWAKKPAIEKAAARKDLFLRSLDDNPSYKQQFSESDAAGQKAIYGDWKTAVETKFPDAWTTDGRILGRTGNSMTITDGRVPIHDFETELTLEALRPIAIKSGDRDTRKEVLDALTPELKKRILPFYAERYGNLQSQDLGDINKDLAPNLSMGRVAEIAGTTALRVGPVLLAAPTRNKNLIAASAALGEGMAESVEVATGSRERISPVEMGLNAALSLIPTAAIAKYANPYVNTAATVGMRAGEGVAQAGLFEGGRQLLEGDYDPSKLAGVTAVGGGLGALLGGIERRLATRFIGKTPQAVREELPDLIAKAKPEEKQALTDLQTRIEQSLGLDSRELAPATLVGIQEGVPEAGIPDTPLYNLTRDAAGTVQDSTVTKQTLEGAGFRVPDAPSSLNPGQRVEIPVADLEPNAARSAGVFQEALEAPNPAASETILAGQLKGEPLPANAQITVMEMGGKKAVQVDIPGGPYGRPLFSGSPQDAIAAGYDITLPDNLSEGRFTYEQLNTPSNEIQNRSPSPESSAQPNDQATSSSEGVPRGVDELVQVSSQGQAPLNSRLRFNSEAGFITPGLIRNAMAPAGGAIAGAAYGANEGDTPTERAANALRYGLLGFGVLSVGSRLAIPGANNIKTFAKELTKGTDGLPNWFQKIRDTGPLLRLRETIGNNPYARLKKDVSAIARTGADITEEANPYLAARLFPGRVDALVKQQADEASQAVKRQIDESLDTLATSSGKTYDEYAQDFQDYVIAKTAKDYNREHADFGKAASGMDDARAEAIVEGAKERGIDKVFEDLRKQVREIDDMALTVREQTGLISKAQADNLRKKYPEHVPLNREIDEADDVGAGVYSVPRFNSPRSGIIAGKGSDKEVADVLTSTLVNLKDAIIRGERNQVGQTVREFYKQNPNPAVVVSRAQTGQVPKNAIAVRYNEGGENRTDWVEFKDKLLADSLRNMNQEVTNPLLRGVGRATNLMTQLFTRFAPSFFLASNPIRDREEVFTNLATSGDIREAARSTVFSNPFRYMKGVSDAALGKPSPMADLYKQAEINGAFTGGLANANRDSASKDLAKVSLDRSFLRKGGDVFAGAFNYINDVMNDSSFLRVYDRAKKSGLSDKEAAMLTRNSSIDFNLKTPLVKSLGSLYGFISPGIHGATTAAKNAIRSPRTIAEATAAFTGIAIAVDAWNSQQDPDWKKKRTLDFYRRNSIPIALGSDEGGTYYFTPPVAQSIRPLKGVADMLSDLAAGDSTDPSVGAKRMAEIMTDSMNPLGGGDAIQLATPTIADPVMDIERNTSYNQGRIYPGYSSTGLDIERVNDRTLTTTTGQGALESAKMLRKMGFDVSPESILYAVRGYGGGPATTAMRAVDSAGSNPDQRQSRGAADWPVISSFIKYVPNDTPTVPTQADETLDDSLEIQAFRELERKQLRAENMNTLRNMQIDPKTKGEIIMKRIAGSSNPQKAQEDVVSGMERSVNKGSNPRATEIMKLQVESGDRARYIVETLKTQTPQERITFIQSLPADALTATVQQQIMAIMQSQAAQPGTN